MGGQEYRIEGASDRQNQQCFHFGLPVEEVLQALRCEVQKQPNGLPIPLGEEGRAKSSEEGVLRATGLDHLPPSGPHLRRLVIDECFHVSEYELD